MHHLSIDLETYSSVPIAKAGAQKYISSPDFEILLFGVSVNGGEVIVYDLAARAAIHEQEVAAAKRLFGMLPPALNAQFTALWDEYEAEETADACFATVLDRILPMLI